MEGAKDALRSWWLVVRCSWLGAVLGTVPGLGAASIDWIVYGHAVRTEKNNSRFGKGDVRGVIAPEASNNAKEGGHLIPTIAFGVPSGASMAVLLSAFLLHGLVPGPEMLTKNLAVTFSMMWSLTIAHVIGAVICLCASGLFARLASVSAGKLVPVALVILFISSVQGSMSWGDVYSVLLFGVVGCVMKALGWPRPPLMLGFVLGALFERYLFISIEIYGAAWMARPIVLVILAAAAWAVFGPLRDSFSLTLREFRRFKPSTARLDATLAFDVAVILLILAALWTSRDWPWEAKLVPHTAAFLALGFAVLNLVSEIFRSPRPAVADGGREDDLDGGPQHMDATIDTADVPFRQAVRRGLRHLGWALGFLVTALAIGLLPACILLVLLQTRFEFGERWRYAIVASAVVGLLLWAVFDRVFTMTWPPSWLGDAWPEARAVLRFI
jgi:putative tricarboxylic transport membrane protein